MADMELFARRVRELRARARSPEVITDRAAEWLAELLDPLSMPDELACLKDEPVAPGPLLLHRSPDLTVFAMTSPPGFASEIHDHGSWGVVGQLAGEEEETIYRCTVENDGVRLEAQQPRRWKPGDVVKIVPPAGDVHRVVVVSACPSITIHAFGDDIVHRGFDLYRPAESTVVPYVGTYRGEAGP